jgi:hypothetical protein
MENGRWKMEKARLTQAVTALRSAMENGKRRFGKPGRFFSIFHFPFSIAPPGGSRIFLV